MPINIKHYYYLTKPGLIYGNLLTVAGGYLYGAIMRPSIVTLLCTAVGSGLVMASGTVINNIFDRDIDKHMRRTKKRALVTGAISPKQAATYAAVLAFIGISLLFVATNQLTMVLGIIGLVTYAGIYTYAKPRTVHATLIGTIPGAIPPLAGYTAATNRVDASFWIILLIMICWQMVHFYAIAVYRKQDYAAANIPVISIVSGLRITKTLMLLYAAGFVISIILLRYQGYAGLLFLSIMLPLGMWWVIIAALGLKTHDNEPWARKVFLISLLLLPTFCVALSLNAWAP